MLRLAARRLCSDRLDPQRRHQRTEFGNLAQRAEALAGVPGIETDLRIFNKPVTRPNRRMGVALALARNGTADEARGAAKAAAAKINIIYGDAET